MKIAGLQHCSEGQASNHLPLLKAASVAAQRQFISRTHCPHHPQLPPPQADQLWYERHTCMISTLMSLLHLP